MDYFELILHQGTPGALDVSSVRNHYQGLNQDLGLVLAVFDPDMVHLLNYNFTLLYSFKDCDFSCNNIVFLVFKGPCTRCHDAQ